MDIQAKSWKKSFYYINSLFNQILKKSKTTKELIKNLEEQNIYLHPYIKDNEIKGLSIVNQNFAFPASTFRAPWGRLKEIYKTDEDTQTLLKIKKRYVENLKFLSKNPEFNEFRKEFQENKSKGKETQAKTLNTAQNKLAKATPTSKKTLSILRSFEQVLDNDPVLNVFPGKLGEIKKIANQSQKAVVIYDTETTGLPNDPNFMLVEIGLLAVLPDGDIYQFDALVNPEAEISEGASNTHGIYAKDVNHLKNFMEILGNTMTNIAKDCILSGYNSVTFDNNLLRKVHTHYNLEKIDFSMSPDTRGMVFYDRKLTQEKPNQKGKLVEVFKDYLDHKTVNEFNKFSLVAHRAMGDVWMTAAIFNILLEKHSNILDDYRIYKASNKFYKLDEPKKQEPIIQNEMSLS